jgi:hypothetical protein
LFHIFGFEEVETNLAQYLLCLRFCGFHEIDCISPIMKVSD